MSSQIPEINNNVIDLELPIEEKKYFRFGKDDSRVVGINTSDLGFVGRMSEAYPKLRELSERATNVTEGISVKDDASSDEVMSNLGTIGDRLKKVDAEMRELIDFMFDAPVSKAAAPDGSMYDMFNGSYRFEIILTAVIGQFTDRYRDEFKALENKLGKHTSKYKGMK